MSVLYQIVLCFILKIIVIAARLPEPSLMATTSSPISQLTHLLHFPPNLQLVYHLYPIVGLTIFPPACLPYQCGGMFFPNSLSSPDDELLFLAVE